MYLALGGGPPGFKRSFTCSVLLGIPLGGLGISRTGLSPSLGNLSRFLHYSSTHSISRSRNPNPHAGWFGLLPVRSPLLGESRLFSFPPVTEMFHFTGYCSSHPIDSGVGNQGFSLAGFSHSDISGSMPICGSPKLFAAYHVLLRHSMPGHSPCALSNLTKLKSRCLSRCFICIPYLCNFQRTVDRYTRVGFSFQNRIQQD